MNCTSMSRAYGSWPYSQNAWDLPQVKFVHTQSITAGQDHGSDIQNKFIEMYGKCKSVENACKVFDLMQCERTLVSWAALFSAYARFGRRREVVLLFWHMKVDMEPDGLVISRVLSSCTSPGDVVQGKLIHAYALYMRLASNTVVGNALVNMYGKGQCLGSAVRIFSEINGANVVSWNVIMAAYAQQGCPAMILKLFRQMQTQGIKPNKITFTTVLSASAEIVCLAEGKRIHASVSLSEYKSDIVVGTALVTMYSRCGNIENAEKEFGQLSKNNVVPFNALIGAYSQHGREREALHCFQALNLHKVEPNQITFAHVLTLCANLEALPVAKAIHAQIIQFRMGSDDIVVDALVIMYGKCGSLEDARVVFESLWPPDIICWTNMAGVYAEHGKGRMAIQLFQQMHENRLTFDKVIFIKMLGAFVSLEALGGGKLIHAWIIQNGFEFDVLVGTSLISVYGKWRNLEVATTIFDRIHEQDVAAWNALVTSYAHLDHPSMALQLFQYMQVEVMMPDLDTCTGILNAFSNLEMLNEGKLLYAYIIQNDLGQDHLLTYVIDMYASCGDLAEAKRAFDIMHHPDIVAWTSLIAVYSKYAHSLQVLELYGHMESGGLHADETAFVSVLNACANLAALEKGKLIHNKIVNADVELNGTVGTALVDMYGKCGCLNDARNVFNQLKSQNLVAWTALITVYAQNGHSTETLHLFKELQMEGLHPDKVTVVSILSSCSHSGLLNEGFHYFLAMSRDYNITVIAEHYACMTDLVGRLGYFDEALDLVSQMLVPPDITLSISLLGASRIYGDAKSGRCILNHMENVSPFMEFGMPETSISTTK